MNTEKLLKINDIVCKYLLMYMGIMTLMLTIVGYTFMVKG